METTATQERVITHASLFQVRVAQGFGAGQSLARVKHQYLSQQMNRAVSGHIREAIQFV